MFNLLYVFVKHENRCFEKIYNIIHLLNAPGWEMVQNDQRGILYLFSQTKTILTNKFPTNLYLYRCYFCCRLHSLTHRLAFGLKHVLRPPQVPRTRENFFVPPFHPSGACMSPTGLERGRGKP